MCYGPLALFHPGIGSVAVILGSQPDTARRTEELRIGRASQGRPESPGSAVCLCGTGESIVGLGACLRDRRKPPQLVVPSHDRRRLLIPGVRWGAFLHGVVSAKQKFAVLLSIALGLSRWNPTG